MVKQLFVKWTLISAVALISTACGNEKVTAQSQSKDEHDHAAMEQKSVPLAAWNVSIKDDRLNAIYQQYVQVTNALINENIAEAKIASNALEAGANAMPGGKAIAASAAKITAAPNLEAQRRAYSKLSNELIALVKKFGVSNGSLYVEFCPMAMNDKGAYWLSNTQEIRNPYYGAEMLTCGEVTETVK